MSRPSNGRILDGAQRRAQLRGGGQHPVTSNTTSPPERLKARVPRLPVWKPADGETVAATIIDRQETKVARYYEEGDFIRLQPLNPLFEAIYEPRTNVRVMGRMVAMIRLHR